MSSKIPARHRPLTSRQRAARPTNPARRSFGRKYAPPGQPKTAGQPSTAQTPTRPNERPYRSSLAQPIAKPVRPYVSDSPVDFNFLQRVSPIVIGNGFLRYCVEREWLVETKQGDKSRYFITPRGKKALPNFGIVI